MSALSTTITVVLVLAIARWLRNEPHQPPPATSPDGIVELRHGQKYLILAIACVLLGPILFIALAVSNREDVTGSIWFPIMIAIVFFIGAWMFLDALRTRVALHANGVRASTPLGRTRYLEWNEIRSISWNPFAGWLGLRAEGKPSIRLSDNLRGRDALLERLRREVGDNAFRGAAKLLLTLNGPSDR